MVHAHKIEFPQTQKHNADRDVGTRAKRVGFFKFGSGRVRVLEKTSGSGRVRVRVLALHLLSIGYYRVMKILIGYFRVYQ